MQVHVIDDDMPDFWKKITGLVFSHSVQYFVNHLREIHLVGFNQYHCLNFLVFPPLLYYRRKPLPCFHFDTPLVIQSPNQPEILNHSQFHAHCPFVQGCKSKIHIDCQVVRKIVGLLHRNQIKDGLNLALFYPQIDLVYKFYHPFVPKSRLHQVSPFPVITRQKSVNQQIHEMRLFKIVAKGPDACE
jgi:hypothetical protein